MSLEQHVVLAIVHTIGVGILDQLPGEAIVPVKAGRLYISIPPMPSPPIDDFGTGLSSFGYLKHFPVDFLKIDGPPGRETCWPPVPGR